MRLRLDQLDGHLRKGVAPVYLVSGDEPLQVGEAADAIRQAAKGAGYLSREVFEAGARFDWNLLGQEADALSLFADKKIVDLRLPGGKPGREGSAALSAWCDDLPADTLLLLTLPKLDRGQLNSKWVKALDRAGVLLQIWPPDAARLPGWVRQRLQAAGLQPAAGVAELLAEHSEGNLLAARQEIEKLLLLHGAGPIGLEQLTEAISDSARFDVFTLVDAALAGQAGRVTRILAGLRGEGVAAPVVLWALAREIRTLSQLARAIAQGVRPEQALKQARIWANRTALVRKGVQRLRPDQWDRLLGRCQQADAIIKGAGAGDPWLVLEQTALAMAGVSVPSVNLVN